jgi:hypothetical protein
LKEQELEEERHTNGKKISRNGQDTARRSVLSRLTTGNAGDLLLLTFNVEMEHHDDDDWFENVIVRSRFYSIALSLKVPPAGPIKLKMLYG